MAPQNYATNIFETKKKRKKTKKTGKLELEERVLELPITGKPGNLIIPLRKSEMQSPRNRIIHLR